MGEYTCSVLKLVPKIIKGYCIKHINQDTQEKTTTHDKIITSWIRNEL